MKNNENYSNSRSLLLEAPTGKVSNFLLEHETHPKTLENGFLSALLSHILCRQLRKVESRKPKDLVIDTTFGFPCFLN